MARKPEMKIEVEGLKDLQKELRRVDKSWAKELQQANKKVAEDEVVPYARARAQESRTSYAGNTTRLGSRGVNSIRAGASGRAALVRAGGAKVPYFHGHEWGTKGTYPQFPGKQKDGHIIFPVLKERREQIIEAYGTSVDELMKRAFPE